MRLTFNLQDPCKGGRSDVTPLNSPISHTLTVINVIIDCTAQHAGAGGHKHIFSPVPAHAVVFLGK